MSELDISALEKAFDSLKKAIDKYNEDESDDFIRDSVIQRYEYTYHLAYKMIQRYLEMTLPEASEIDTMTFKELIRKAIEKGLLLGDLEQWDLYRLRRNVTSHTYDEKKALLVVEVVPDFIKDIDYLIKKIEV